MWASLVPVKSRAAYAAFGSLRTPRRCPPSIWNAVRLQRGTVSAITLEHCPPWRGIRSLRPHLSFSTATALFTRRCSPVEKTNRRYPKLGGISVRWISVDFRARPSNSESGRHSAGPRCIVDSPMNWEGFGQKAKAKAMKIAAERLRKLWKARRGKVSTTCSHSQCWKSGRGASIRSSISRSASFRIKAH